MTYQIESHDDDSVTRAREALVTARAALRGGT